MAFAVKPAVTASSERIAMASPVGRSPLGERPSPAQIECNHACARFADVVSSRVGGRRDGGGRPRQRRLDHLPLAACAAGGGRCTTVMARCLSGSDRSTRCAPLGSRAAGRRASAAIALNSFSSTLPLTAFRARRTSRNKLWSFRSLSDWYDRKGSREDPQLEGFAARCYSSQCWRCSRMTSTSPQPQMLHRSRRRSLSQTRRLGRMGSGGGRSTGERGVMAAAFKKSGEEEGGKEHEQGGKSLSSPPSMFSVKQVLGGGKGGEQKLMAASSRDAPERSVDVGVSPGADSGAASLSSSSSPLRFSSSKSFQLAAAMLQAAIVGGVLNGLDPILLTVAALAGIAEVLVENKDVQNLIENLATKNSRQRFSNNIELQHIVRKLENILDKGKQEGKVDLSLLDESDQQILRSVLFLLREDERDLPEVSPTDSISTEGSPTAVRTDKSGTGTDLSSLVQQLASMTGLKAPWENGDSTSSLRDNSSSSLSPPKFTAVNSKQKMEWRSYLMPYVANALEGLIDLPPMQMPELFGKATIAGGLRTKELLMEPIAPSENDLQAFNLGEDAVAEWANYVNAVPREKIYIPLTISNNVTFQKPFKVVVFGQPLVLFRPSPGEIAALPDACPHRGASLSMGVLVMNDHASSRCVRCPYHGLEFSSEGKCQKPNIHLNPVKVVETNGIVWIEEQPLTFEDAMDLGEELAPFLQMAEQMVGMGVVKDALQEEDAVSSGEKQTKINGQDPFADAPFTAHFRMPGYAITQGAVEIKAPPKAVVDNTFDLHHMHHVHATTFGGGELLETLQPNPNTICFRYGMRRSNPMRPFFGNGCVQVKMERFPPYSALITVGDAEGKVQVKTMSHVVPTSATTSTLVWQLLRNFCTPAVFNPIFDIAVKRILSEDKVVLEGVNFQGIRKGMELGT